MSTDVQVYSNRQQLTVFSDTGSFELAQRQAKALAESDLVPTTYRGKLANCLIALEISQRVGASVLAVMQSMHLINGRPSWGSSYIIAALNSSGKFAPLKFKIEGAGDTLACTAWTTDKQGELLEGPTVTIAMAKAEGWYDKQGSKWKTMPSLMIRYRAAAFFGRLYAPEILLGMRSDDEEREIIEVDSTVEDANPAAALNAKIRAKKKAPAPTVVTAEAIPAGPVIVQTMQDVEPAGSEHF